jgi:nucleotide-binding universal stress UspA family protein
MTNLARPDDWDDPVQLPEVRAPRRVLVPFDGSHNAERALAWAELIAASASAEIVIVVAYEQPLTMRGRGAAYIETVRDELAVEATHLAEEAVGLLRAHDVSARGIVVKGEPARAILDVADDEECELIVLGRQGLTAEVRGVSGALDRFRELLQGGVADKVSRHASVPVLVVV